MNMQLLIDPSCDLPTSIYEKYNARILPTLLKLNGKEFLDYRGDQYSGFYRQKKYVSGKKVDTEPAPQDVLTKELTEAAKANDHVLVITACRKRSQTYFRIQPIIQSLQDTVAAKIKVVDSRSLFAGESVLAAHALALWQRKHDFTGLRRKLDAISDKIYCYMVPADLMHVRERAQKRGDTDVSWLSAALASTIDVCPIVLFKDEENKTLDKVKGFNNAVDKVLNSVSNFIERKPLLCPYLSITYAGGLEEVTERESYQQLLQKAKERHIKILLAQMSLTSTVHIGLGGFTLGMACDDEPLNYVVH
ncbi:DegV family protein [Marinibactrum halimedae]|uniref:DegV family EDD domain-containing protein n=1 Tax=Marinibactrum halimedae TaxID=1444977 RepID=A0AA37T845_9GAMM|nr:DegV family protein [Marinibactrum halimedae]MCD9458566.1 DegV family protein [Marinibactrum halimedae]GLS26567.1 hypothetical protein GCM10007877_22830 [Marinibactrum halimedae]